MGRQQTMKQAGVADAAKESQHADIF